MSNYSIGRKYLQSNPKKEEYNNIPVVYCKHCLSLNIRDMDGVEFCDKCGSTDIETSHISEWEVLYEQKYKEKFLNKKGIQ